MDRDYKRAIDLFGEGEDKFYEWLRTFRPAYRIRKGVDSAGFMYFSCVYTDGDGGVMVFKGFSEIFEHEGMEITTVSNYCDICYDTMACILLDMEEEAEKTNEHNEGIEI